MGWVVCAEHCVFAGAVSSRPRGEVPIRYQAREHDADVVGTPVGAEVVGLLFGAAVGARSVPMSLAPSFEPPQSGLLRALRRAGGHVGRCKGRAYCRARRATCCPGCGGRGSRRRDGVELVGAVVGPGPLFGPKFWVLW